MLGTVGRGNAPLSHWLACSLVAVALAFPIVFSVLDHHAGERIPSHSHLVALGEVAQVHVHEFQAPHLHGSPVGITIDRDDLAVYSAASGPSLLLYLLIALAFPFFSAGLALKVGLGWPPAGRGLGSGQISARPPTPPPTSARARI